MEVRNNWTREEIEAIYHQPILDLIYQAASVHRQNHEANEVQVCTLLSIKTGGCPEDCAYCPQAARYNTDVDHESLLNVEEVLTKSKYCKTQWRHSFLYGCGMAQCKK